MKAAFLINNAAANEAFEIRETAIPKIANDEILIKVKGFGLNYADVMARQGLYRDAPPLPAILGYDVCGYVEKIGSEVEGIKEGDFVAALTRFGGYAQFAMTKASGVIKVDENINVAEATALATQYGTAWYAAKEMANIQQGEKVLIHAAAGGVGTALVQLAKQNGCTIYGTAGSDEKLAYLKTIGVDYPINYRASNWFSVMKNYVGDEGVDAVFDAIGGKNAKQGWQILSHGGRLILFGAAQLGDENNIFKKIKFLLQFGFYHPVQLMGSSKTISGVNMLRIADYKPKTLQRCLENVKQGFEEGYLKPTVAKVFPIEQIGAAHEFLASRKSIGKVAVEW